MTRRRSRVAVLATLALALVLAGCSGGQPNPDPVDLGDVATPGAVSSVTSVGALGDSVTLGVNACDEPGWCPARSWATGDDPGVGSVALRIGAATGTFPETENAAKDGGTLADGIGNADDVIAADPQLVLLLLGGNDVCSRDMDTMTSVDDFRTGYTTLLTKLSTELPDATLVAMSIPNLYMVWELGHQQDAAVDVWAKSSSCRNLLGDPRATGQEDVERREAVATRNAELNQVISEVCTSDLNCTYDDGALFDYKFAPEEISSIDYFHPSAVGEAVIAEMAWDVVVEAMSQ